MTQYLIKQIHALQQWPFCDTPEAKSWYVDSKHEYLR